MGFLDRFKKTTVVDEDEHLNSPLFAEPETEEEEEVAEPAEEVQEPAEPVEETSEDNSEEELNEDDQTQTGQRNFLATPLVRRIAMGLAALIVVVLLIIGGRAIHHHYVARQKNPVNPTVATPAQPGNSTLPSDETGGKVPTGPAKNTTGSGSKNSSTKQLSQTGPKSLPATGPASSIAIFSASTVIAGIAHFVYRRQRV